MRLFLQIFNHYYNLANFFEQDDSPCLGYFNTAPQKLIGWNDLKSDPTDLAETDIRTNFEPACSQSITMNYKAKSTSQQSTNSITTEKTKRSIFEDVDIQSLEGNFSHSEPEESDKASNFEGNEVQALEKIAQSVENSPDVSNYSDHTASDSKSVYKAPNYKNKKKSNAVYTTKHGTFDIKEHEDLMEQKYGVKLSIRRDVVNKTLFRSLKRFYTDKFNEFYVITKKDSTANYMEKIHYFTLINFSQKTEDLNSKGLTIDQVEKFMSIMISPNHVKSALTDITDINLHKDYYSCLYQYSHKKLANMLLSPVCGYLFTDFINSRNLTNFISTCSTMSQHPEAYEKAGINFLQIIMGLDKKAVKAAKSMKVSQSVI